MPLRFTKMHGLGNDFMVIDALSQSFELTPEQISAFADRRTGIGFDQLLIVAPPDDPDADFWYRIFNADGTSAEQCGNGARCDRQGCQPFPESFHRWAPSIASCRNHREIDDFRNRLPAAAAPGRGIVHQAQFA